MAYGETTLNPGALQRPDLAPDKPDTVPVVVTGIPGIGSLTVQVQIKDLLDESWPLVIERAKQSMPELIESAMPAVQHEVRKIGYYILGAAAIGAAGYVLAKKWG